MKKVLFTLAFALFACASFASAQPRPVTSGSKTSAHAPAPSVVKAKYQGGMFGYSKKFDGTLKFDDANQRLVCFDKDQKEKFTIPYASILVISPNTTKVQSGTGKVVSAIPVLGAGLGGSLIKSKKNYMQVQFNDVDVNAQGTAVFLFDSDEMRTSVIQTLGEKAEMKQRGDAYFRPAVKRTDF